MVAIKCTVNQILMFGKYRIKFGMNEIPDADFYELMKAPLFASRVKSGKFILPAEFPLEKPRNETAKEDAEQEKTEAEGRLNIKQTLKQIAKSDDKEYLKNLIEVDGRPGIKEEARARLSALNALK